MRKYEYHKNCARASIAERAVGLALPSRLAAYFIIIILQGIISFEWSCRLPCYTLPAILLCPPTPSQPALCNVYVIT